MINLTEQEVLFLLFELRLIKQEERSNTNKITNNNILKKLVDYYQETYGQDTKNTK
jgi:hypothetical protein